MIYIIGSGYIGSSLAEHFSDRGYNLTVLGRNQWPGRFEEQDTIINCAASGYRKQNYGVEGTVRDNWELPVRLDRERNGANMIHVSSWVEECHTDLPYAWSKALATRYFEDKGNAHILMTCSVWGGRYETPDKFIGSFLRKCRDGEPFVIRNFNARRDFVHVESFCHAVEALTKHKDYKKRYFATGRMRSFGEVYWELCHIAGKYFPNVVMGDDGSITYDWKAKEPYFEDTFREDLKREWEKITA